ncbi:amidohydrolase [Marinifilum flexuosum]|uniref:Amidohydrolase n=1 Tax=Marinifilum flexuosum TaxID=1117708 RepID=A0A419X9P6_9BACT|nr:amidohydrolase [Marinifilum flexuosum]RKE04290.1 amidohydrolase [Marinifilum flexuosum]
MNTKLVALRHQLHSQPELSNKEYKTAQIIVDFVEDYQPHEIIHLGDTGRAFVFKGAEAGKTTVFRAELDALPIEENTRLKYASIYNGVAHACGHDGHMAILAGMAQQLSENPPRKGKVILLFQPAEEVEQGARDVLLHPKFADLNPDYMFALHNVPGQETNTILLRRGSFSAASKGMTIRLKGKTSHAAEPEKGRNPAIAISKISRELNDLLNNKALFTDLTLLTFIYIRMGEQSFGTSAGNGEMGITLRSFENADMKVLTQKSEEIVNRIAAEENLECSIAYHEEFPATVNQDECVDMLQDLAEEHNLSYQYLDKPFKWSEDFGYFSQKYTCGFFGLGAGIDQAALHHPDYDFPDEIIETGLTIFTGLYQKINGK